jgi:hypothetical protein
MDGYDSKYFPISMILLFWRKISKLYIMRIQNKINNETTMTMTRTAGYESLDEITKDLEDGRGIGDVKGGTYNILHEIQKDEDDDEEEEEEEEEIRDLEGLEMIPHHEEDEMGK